MSIINVIDFVSASPLMSEKENMTAGIAAAEIGGGAGFHDYLARYAAQEIVMFVEGGGDISSIIDDLIFAGPIGSCNEVRRLRAWYSQILIRLDGRSVDRNSVVRLREAHTYVSTRRLYLACVALGNIRKT